MGGVEDSGIAGLMVILALADVVVLGFEAGRGMVSVSESKDELVLGRLVGVVVSGDEAVTV